jgi:alpha-tubulin suppressor-like RCC1 family protein
MFFYTVSNSMKVWDGATWSGTTPLSFIKQVGTGTLALTASYLNIALATNLIDESAGDMSYSSGVFTVSEAGNFEFGGFIGIENNSDQRASISMQIYVDGVATGVIQNDGYIRNNSSNPNWTAKLADEPFALTASQTIEVRALAYGGDTNTEVDLSQSQLWLKRMTGDKGATGSAGAQGIQGETGETGAAGAGTGSVTSVDVSVPLGFEVSGAPITVAGTLAVSFSAGYSLPATASQTNWNTSYGWGDHASAGYLTPTGDGSALTGLPAGGATAIGTNSALSYADGQLFVSATGIAYWKLNDGSTGWYEVGQLLLNAAGEMGDSIVGGRYHTSMIKADGSVWSTGANDRGQFGDGTVTDSSSFVASSITSGAVRIFAGFYTTSVIKDDGSVWSTGENTYGSIGDGTTDDRNTFVATNITSGAVQLGGGQYTTLVIKDDGSIWSTGRNNQGQLGDGTFTDRDSFGTTTITSGAIDISSTKSSFTLVIKDDGSVWGVGYNGYGNLGDGTLTNKPNFSATSITSGAVSVASGQTCTLVVKDDGSVWGTGDNYFGLIGDGANTNRTSYVASNITSGAIKITCGQYHSVVLKDDGSVWAAGSAQFGQIGDGTTTDKNTFVPTNITSGAITISGGQDFTSVIKDDGSVWAVGRNTDGKLGDGTATDRSSFVVTTITSGAASPPVATRKTVVELP